MYVSYFAEIILVALVLSPAAYATDPTLPQAQVNITMPNKEGYAVKTVCASGCNHKTLHDAYTVAACGTLIQLTHGQTFVETSWSPGSKRCDDNHWIIIETDPTALANLPASGTRINPATHAQWMPKLTSNTRDCIIKGRLDHVRFIGIEFQGNVDGWNCLALFGDGSTTDPSTKIIVDRCYGHGGATLNGNFGFGSFTGNFAVLDSVVNEIHMTDRGDTQAITIPGEGDQNANARGPILIQNNELVSAGENVLFGGGGDGNSYDITITRNYFHKLTKWHVNSADYAGIHWAVKNLLEFKAAVRVLVEGNVFQYSWADAQTGFCLLITPRSSANGPNTRTDDITLRYNIFSHCAQGIATAAWDGEDRKWNYQTMGVQLHRLGVHDNVFDDLDYKWGGDNANVVLLWGDGPVDGHITHNTFVNQRISTANMGDPPAATGCKFENNIAGGGPYGWHGLLRGRGGTGTPALKATCADYTFLNNASVADATVGVGGTYPATTRFPASWSAVRFASYNGGSGGDYRLCTGVREPVALCPGRSPLHNAASDGTDVGANIIQVNTFTAGAIRGVWSSGKQ